MSRISSFPPIISKKAKVLILGTIPGVKSLEIQQYYAHPQNQFWRILFHLFNENLIFNYSEKIKFLEKNNIALWDVINSCERSGSLDSEIRNEVANDILELLNQNPNIKSIFCNGQKSYKNLIKILGKNAEIPIVALPSTSPAFANITIDEKTKHWKQILPFIT